MKFKVKDYLKSKEFVLMIYQRDGLEAIPQACALSHVPCIVAYKMIYDFDKNEECLVKIEDLKQFYVGSTVE